MYFGKGFLIDEEPELAPSRICSRKKILLSVNPATDAHLIFALVERSTMFKGVE